MYRKVLLRVPLVQFWPEVLEAGCLMFPGICAEWSSSSFLGGGRVLSMNHRGEFNTDPYSFVYHLFRYDEDAAIPGNPCSFRP